MFRTPVFAVGLAACGADVSPGQIDAARQDAERPVHRISTAYPGGLSSDPADWVDCRSLERTGADPAWLLPEDGPSHPPGTTFGDCRCTRDTVRMAAAIKGFEYDGVAYEPGDVEIEGTIHLGERGLYPGDPDEAPACMFYLGGPRIRDSVRIRGVQSAAGLPTVSGGAMTVWTPSLFGEPQPEPSIVVFEDLWLENTGPGIQTGTGSFADVTLRDVDVHATRLAPDAPFGCPANGFALVFHHRGTLNLERVSALASYDDAIPVPSPAAGCFFPGPARAVAMAVGLAPELDMVVRDSVFEVLDPQGDVLDDGVAVYVLANPDTSIDIRDSDIAGDRGVYARFHGGPLNVSRSTFRSGAAAISVDASAEVHTRDNLLDLYGEGVGIQVGPRTAPSTLVADVVEGDAAIGVEVSGIGHAVVRTDLSGLDANSDVLLTAQSSECTAVHVSGTVTDEGVGNTIAPP